MRAKIIVHKYVTIAVFRYKTSYHASIGCERSRVVQERILCNFAELKLVFCPQQATILTLQIVPDVLKQKEMIYQVDRNNAMQAYINCKAYYDKKTNDLNLKEENNLFIIQPKSNYQGRKVLLAECFLIDIEKAYY